MAEVAATLLGRETQIKLKRFDIHQIFQHAGMAISFTMLVITGLPMKFNNWPLSIWWSDVWGGVGNLRSAHHFFAWVMVLTCVYHLAYLVYTQLVMRKPFPVKMIPSAWDFITLFQEFKYFIGIRKERPDFDRFNWREKFDYWAIFWGMPVMAGSGFVLMYPVFVTQYLPGWVVTVAYVAHSDEAMLALSWIFMVHVFFAHFSPGVFPMNTSIFTGKVSREQYRREHPKELRSIEGEIPQE